MFYEKLCSVFLFVCLLFLAWNVTNQSCVWVFMVTSNILVLLHKTNYFTKLYTFSYPTYQSKFIMKWGGGLSFPYSTYICQNLSRNGEGVTQFFSHSPLILLKIYKNPKKLLNHKNHKNTINFYYKVFALAIQTSPRPQQRWKTTTREVLSSRHEFSQQ